MTKDETGFELSVVANDLRLENSPSGRDLLESVHRHVRNTPVRYTPPSSRKTVTAARPTRVSLDDPDELYTATRQAQMRQKRSWLYPALNTIAFTGRLLSPIVGLAKSHPDTRSFLSATPLLFWMQLPLLFVQLIFVIVGYTPILRGTPILNAVSPLFFVTLITGMLWQWAFKGYANIRVAIFASAIRLALAIVTLLVVHKKRRQGLMGVWQHNKRNNLKMRDFWLVKLPVVCELIWGYVTLIIMANHQVVYEWLLHHPDELYSVRLAERMLTSGIVSLLVSVSICVFFLGRRRVGHTVVVIAGAWFFFDQSRSFGAIPDVVTSPQLAWVDPYTLGASFQCACAIVASILCLLSFISIWLQLAQFAAMVKGFAFDGDDRSVFSFLGARSMPAYPTDMDWDTTRKGVALINSEMIKRRPSEFLMRDDSNLTDALTPMRKK